MTLTPGAQRWPPAAPRPPRNAFAQGIRHGKTDRLPQTRGLLRRIVPIWCESVRQVRYLFIIKAILKDSKVVVCWIVKAFARTSASSS
ncbi:hypothetical protein GNZ11_14255 [Paraburkholderia xenovorans]|nr:hypothetical protein [Paraburkholderia xenovorans]